MGAFRSTRRSVATAPAAQAGITPDDPLAKLTLHARNTTLAGSGMVDVIEFGA